VHHGIEPPPFAANTLTDVVTHVDDRGGDGRRAVLVEASIVVIATLVVFGK
jgi:hypothetical protein